MTNAQTEARAIALDIFHNAVDSDDGSESMDMPVAIDIIATALAAKDAELVEKDRLLEIALRETAPERDAAIARAERAEAQLAEARKALAALDRMSRGVDWCDQDEQARRWSAARRALDRLNAMKGESE